jgi:hypothetical protein
MVQLEAEVEAMEADRTARRMRKEVERLEKLVEQPPRLGRHKFKPAPLQVRKKVLLFSLACSHCQVSARGMAIGLHIGRDAMLSLSLLPPPVPPSSSLSVLSLKF